MRRAHLVAGLVTAVAFLTSLSADVRPSARPRILRLQWVGTILLIVSSTLLITAFVVEPIAGLGRTAVSAFGIFTLVAGAILHVIASQLGRIPDVTEPREV